MNLYLRFLMILISSFFKPRLSDILAPSILRLRVLPNDLDLNGHMNNGRYLALMDLGRLDLVLRTGLLKIMLGQRSVPVLANVQVRFRLSLDPFNPFDLETRVICWDEKWVYLEQRFILIEGEKAGQVAAIALVKGSFFNKKTKTTVPTQTLLNATGTAPQSPAFPDYITRWIDADAELKNVTKTV
jgi:acyl-CoA thioesterase FadM